MSGTPPDSTADIYCAVAQTDAGFYLSVWSFKAKVWVRLLNRYVDRPRAIAQIEAYGFKHWDSPVAPHSRDKHRNRT